MSWPIVWIFKDCADIYMYNLVSPQTLQKMWLVPDFSNFCFQTNLINIQFHVKCIAYFVKLDPWDLLFFFALILQCSPRLSDVCYGRLWYSSGMHTVPVHLTRSKLLSCKSFTWMLFLWHVQLAPAALQFTCSLLTYLNLSTQRPFARLNTDKQRGNHTPSFKLWKTSDVYYLKFVWLRQNETTRQYQLWT